MILKNESNDYLRAEIHVTDANHLKNEKQIINKKLEMQVFDSSWCCYKNCLCHIISK